MKAVFFLSALVITVSAQPSGRTAWRWLQAVEVTVPGINRLDLPPATLDLTIPSLADLRLISPDGVETPWLSQQPAPPRNADVATSDFNAKLDGRTTVLSATHHAGPIRGVMLESPAPSFLKSVRIEGGRDGIAWQPLAAGEVVFRQNDGVQRLRIAFAPADWPRLRVTIDDDRSPPVAFTGLRVTPVAEPVEQTDHPLILAGREEVAGESRLTLDLGAKNLHLAELRLDVPEGVFSRRCRVEALSTSRDGQPVRQPIGDGTIYRVLGENGSTAAEFAIPLNQRAAGDQLLLTIRNGDSPPLEIRGVMATRFPDRLLFHAGRTGTWTLLSGNHQAAAPSYDLSALRVELSRAPGNTISPGPPAAKSDYRPPPAVPGVEPGGSGIDLSGWARRRRVDVAKAGVIQIDLDAMTQAHAARSDLGDLRLIQNGRQIPWLLDSSPPHRELRLEVADDPDPKRPAISRWKLTQSAASLPLETLTLDSPDLLFTRHLRVFRQDRDELGNWRTRMIGSASWTKAPGGQAAARKLDIPLGGERVPGNLWIETENGDNPPIRLGTATVHYRAPRLIAKPASADPVWLYYDNPRASPPVYDLDLVRNELLAADKQIAAMGGEEPVKPGKRGDGAAFGTGSPWLWAALALVVVGLLAIIAKLLPKEPGNQDG